MKGERGGGVIVNEQGGRGVRVKGEGEGASGCQGEVGRGEVVTERQAEGGRGGCQGVRVKGEYSRIAQDLASSLQRCACAPTG